MRLQTRFVIWISTAIVGVLVVSESVRQGYERYRMHAIEHSYPDRLEAATRENLSPIAEATQGLRDAMGEGNMELFQRILDNQRSAGMLEATLYDGDGKAAYSSDPKRLGQYMAPSVLNAIQASGKPTDRRVGDALETYQPFVATTVCMGCHPDWKERQIGGVLNLRMSNGSFLRVQQSWLESMTSLSRDSLILGIVASVVLVLVLVWLVVIIVRNQLAGPLSAATDFVQTISKGDLTRELDPRLRGREDELGVLGRAMDHMSKQLRSLLKDIRSGVQTTQTASLGLHGAAEQTAKGVERVMAKSQSVSSAAGETSVRSQSMAETIEEATTNLTCVSQATEEMNRGVGQLSATFDKARATTEQVQEHAHDISEAMRRLSEAAQAIGRVTDTLSRISSQSQKLAERANMEAARAGELGHSYAVVAGEVRKLARLTATATQDVKGKIAGVQESSRDAIIGLERISAVIRELGWMVNDTAKVMDKQRHLTKNAAERIGQASTGVVNASRGVAESASASRNIAVNMGELTDAVGEIRQGGVQVQDSAKALSDLADDLQKLVAQFRLPNQREGGVGATAPH
jgi:methyl-accepting chemotaxis protein